MKPFTVVLLLPNFLQDLGSDNYVAFVHAINAKEAVKVATEEARRAHKCARKDLAHLVTFEGHPKIARFNFEI